MAEGRTVLTAKTRGEEKFSAINLRHTGCLATMFLAGSFLLEALQKMCLRVLKLLVCFPKYRKDSQKAKAFLTECRDFLTDTKRNSR